MNPTLDPTLVLFIPKMNAAWSDEQKVRYVFEQQNIGMVHHVEFIKRKKRRMDRKHSGSNYIRSAHVYFSAWYDNIAARNLQSRVLDSKREARIVFDDPWYWLLMKSDKTPKWSQYCQTEMRFNSLTERVSNDEIMLLKLRDMLVTQNKAIQELQSFCFKQGLNVPFWDPKNPPPVEESSIELETAKVTVACADNVLADDGADDGAEYEEKLCCGYPRKLNVYDDYMGSDYMDLQNTAVACAEAVLQYGAIDHLEDTAVACAEAVLLDADFIPVNDYYCPMDVDYCPMDVDYEEVDYAEIESEFPTHCGFPRYYEV
jgi:hypothetical protein